MAIAPYVNLMIDSGAFSNYSEKLKSAAKGKKHNPITLEEYISACKQYFDGRVWQYVMLDVIRNREQSEYNLQAMLDAGLKPMPVFIEGYTYEQINDLLAINRRICVAGGVGSADQYIYQRYQKVFQASGGRALIHGLGFLRWPDVFQLPIATGDSSTNSSGARFGHISFYDKRWGTKRIHWRDLLSGSGKNVDHYAELLGRMRSYGITIEQMSNPASYSKQTGIHAILEMYASLQFQDHASQVGFGMFLALSNATWLKSMIATIAAMDGKFFDYNESARLQQEYMRYWKEDEGKTSQRIIDETIRVLQSKTDYKAKTLTEDQTVRFSDQFVKNEGTLA